MKPIVRELKINGASIRYAEVGSGPQTILMAHGLRANHRGLLPLAGMLGANYRVLIPDMPGQGASSIGSYQVSPEGYGQFLYDFAKQLDLAKPILLGHSYGSLPVIVVQSQHHLGSSIILVSPLPPQTWRERLPAAFYWIGRSGPLSLAKWLHTSKAFNDPMRRLIMVRTKDEHLRDEIMAEGRVELTETNPRTIGELYYAILQTPIQSLYRTISQPVLVVSGTQDPIAPFRRVQRTYAAHANLFRGIEASGHLMHYEQTSEIAAVIRSWLTANMPAEAKSEGSNSTPPRKPRRPSR